MGHDLNLAAQTFTLDFLAATEGERFVLRLVEARDDPQRFIEWLMQLPELKRTYGFDTVAGLRLGADDYLTKDASLPHLLARIAALFRRLDAQGADADAEDVAERGPLRLDLKRVTATWRGERVDLTLTEFWIVHALVRHPGHVKSREQLMGEARMVVDDSTVTSHVKRIRKKLVALDPGFDRIESVYGMGYRWRED